MPRIIEEAPYGGAYERLDRLGLKSVLDEARAAVTEFQLLVKEEKDANGGAAVRKMIDARFARMKGWQKGRSGDIDWSKCKIVNGTRVCLGVEIQFSARSDLMIIDVSHLRQAIASGKIDVGAIVTPGDRLAHFLTDRGPSISAGKRHVHEARAEDLPIVLIAIEHDGAGPPLAKQEKRSRKE
jgi:hypothetical protein